MNLGGHPTTGFSLGAAEDRHIALDVGDTFRVTLPGKEGTGYGWVVTPGDPRVVAVDGHSVEGEKQVFTLAAKGPGTTRLVFAYRHPWENVAPIKTVTFGIKVGRWSWSWPWFGAGVAAGVVVASGVTYAVTRKRRAR